MERFRIRYLCIGIWECLAAGGELRLSDWVWTACVYLRSLRLFTIQKYGWSPDTICSLEQTLQTEFHIKPLLVNIQTAKASQWRQEDDDDDAADDDGDGDDDGHDDGHDGKTKHWKVCSLVLIIYCETQPPASIGWVALSSVIVRPAL